MAEKYDFLSDDWFAATKRIRDEHEGEGQQASNPMKMNLVITDVPFQDGEVNFHMDTSSGGFVMDTGHLDEPELTLTTEWETAKAVFVDQDPQAGMQAFMQGKIKVQGDMTKLMSMQQQAPDPEAQKITEKIQDITA